MLPIERGEITKNRRKNPQKTEPLFRWSKRVLSQYPHFLYLSIKESDHSLRGKCVLWEAEVENNDNLGVKKPETSEEKLQKNASDSL